jgi:Pyruvate/2-oxoglutarate dehydrogenase complex, dihydrolipoamide acyltransferase (E2) component, and related enzymes
MFRQEILGSYVKEFDIQRKMVAHMTSLSWQNIPHISYLYEPDITEFYNEFKALASEQQALGRRISINTILLKVIIEGLKADPELNALLEYNLPRGRGSVTIREDINLSIPWKVADGRMITPTLLHTESMSLSDLSEAIGALGKKVERTNVDELIYKAVVTNTVNELKRGNLGVIHRILANLFRITRLKGPAKKAYYAIPEDERLTDSNLIAGTVTVSNIGSLYKEQRGYFGLLEVIPPQIFAIGLGAIQEKPGIFVNANGQKEIGIRQTLPMCLAFDHRAIDFDALVPFLKKLDEIFANPEVMRRW